MWLEADFPNSSRITGSFTLLIALILHTDHDNFFLKTLDVLCVIIIMIFSIVHMHPMFHVHRWPHRLRVHGSTSNEPRSHLIRGIWCSLSDTIQELDARYVIPCCSDTFIEWPVSKLCPICGLRPSSMNLSRWCSFRYRSGIVGYAFLPRLRNADRYVVTSPSGRWMPSWIAVLWKLRQADDRKMSANSCVSVSQVAALPVVSSPSLQFAEHLVVLFECHERFLNISMKRSDLRCIAEKREFEILIVLCDWKNWGSAGFEPANSG